VIIFRCATAVVSFYPLQKVKGQFAVWICVDDGKKFTVRLSAANLRADITAMVAHAVALGGAVSQFGQIDFGV
jgi:hypothetical protein